MRVDFRNAEGEMIGSVTLAKGEPVFTGRAEGLLGELVVLKPGDPRRELTAADGEAWLRAIPSEFRSGYLTAEFVK